MFISLRCRILTANNFRVSPPWCVCVRLFPFLFCCFAVSCCGLHRVESGRNLWYKMSFICMMGRVQWEQQLAHSATVYTHQHCPFTQLQCRRRNECHTNKVYVCGAQLLLRAVCVPEDTLFEVGAPMDQNCAHGISTHSRVHMIASFPDHLK